MGVLETLQEASDRCLNFLKRGEVVNQSTRPRRLMQCSLRALLVLFLLVAAYWSGWVSHRAWNQKNVSETMRRALLDFEEIQTKNPVKIETVEGSDIYMTRGKKEDVDKVQQILDQVESAAKK